MIYKLCTSCGRKIPEGTICPCRKARKAAGDKQYDKHQRDKKATAFYRSPDWIRTRARILARSPIDVYMYMTKGKVIPADTVHHIIPLRSDWSKRLEVSNLMSLHHDTHSMLESEYKRRGEKTMVCLLQRILHEYRDKDDAEEFW